MTQSPKIGASTIVFDGEKVLLAKRGKEPYKNSWSFPGGAQELGETLEACAKRELLEEAALKADKFKFITMKDRINHNDAGEITHHYVLATFLVEEFSGTAQAGDDALELQWVNIDEIAGMDVTPGTLELMHKVFGA